MDLNLRRAVLDKNLRMALIAVFLALVGITAYFTYNAFSLPEELERNVTIYSYEHRGDFNFLVYLKPNSLYNTEVLGPGEKLYFTKITDRTDTSFAYSFIINKPASVNSQVEVVAELATDKWRKTYTLNKTSFNSNAFIINLPFNPNFFLDEVDKINKETGVPAARTDLKIVYNIRTIAKTDSRVIDELFAPAISIALTKTDFNITGSQYRKAGDIKRREIILQMEVLEKRGQSMTFASLAFVALLAFTLLTKSRALERKDAVLTRAEKKYGGWIANATDLPVHEGNISLASFDDLVKVAGELGKPIIRKTAGEQHAYYVFDGSLRYEYIVAKKG